MSATLDISRMRVRYRVPAADPAVRRQLDAVLDRVLDDALEPALVRRGVPIGEEICVRTVHAPARLRLDAGEAGAAETWSSAIADAIAAAVSSGGADVVRYRSRHVALVDLALGVAEGRLARVWAWRRLGIWRGSEAPDARGRAAELTFALASEPASVVAVLAHVARAGALPELVRIVAREEWIELARAGLAAAGASERVVEAAIDRVRARAAAENMPPGDGVPLRLSGFQPQTPDSDLDVAARLAARVARASVVAHAAGGAGPLPVETAVALAVLAWLEADPAAVGAASVRRAVDVVVDVAGELSPVGARELLSADRTDPAVGEDVVPGAEGEAETPAAEVTPPVAKEEPTAPAPEHTPPPEAGEEETPAAADDHADEHDVLLPARALTSYGGLLFLLGVLDELDIPAGACRTAPLERRPLRWTLHRLALTLAPLAPEDPAALAFAGLPPDADPPGDDDRSQTDEETLALDELAARVEEHLGERLAPADIPPDELLDFVCRRRAEIVFDPGWLELRLPLDEVSVELRRAAIDLDPGWLPWLGVVVRFVYG